MVLVEGINIKAQEVEIDKVYLKNQYYIKEFVYQIPVFYLQQYRF